MEVRALTVDDADSIHSTLRDWEVYWELPRASSKARAMEWVSAPSVNMPRDTRSFWIGDTLAGYGLVSHMPGNRGFEVVQVQGIIHPDHRRGGLGRDLLGWQVDRARERLQSTDPSNRWLVRASTWDWIDDALHMYRRFGFEPVRTYAEMLKELDTPTPPRLPPGATLIPWDRALDEETRLVNNEAFADHWGAVPMTAGNWRIIVGAKETRVDQSYMALAGDEVIGSVLNAFYPGDESVTGRREGWVRVLSVKRDRRGRGLGSALLNASFNAFIQAGYTHSMIRVDAESLTGAHRLYENHGYRTIRSFSLYDREL